MMRNYVVGWGTLALINAGLAQGKRRSAVDAPGNSRLSEAIDIIRSRRRQDGRWPLEYSYKGRTYFQLERIGAPSRWNTLRALRVLKWWDRREAPEPAREN